MPTYGYRCSACGHAFDALQKISDSPLKECPGCKQDALKREIGGGSALFQFKGDGFYLTDYVHKKAEPESCPCGKNKSDCTGSSAG